MGWAALKGSSRTSVSGSRRPRTSSRASVMDNLSSMDRRSQSNASSSGNHANNNVSNLNINMNTRGPKECTQWSVLGVLSVFWVHTTRMQSYQWGLSWWVFYEQLVRRWAMCPGSSNNVGDGHGHGIGMGIGLWIGIHEPTVYFATMGLRSGSGVIVNPSPSSSSMSPQNYQSQHFDEANATRSSSSFEWVLCWSAIGTPTYFRRIFHS